MKQFLVTLPRNLIGCFKGRMIVWHVIAILLTFILVMSGFDWRYFLATRNPALRSWMWPAVVIGMLLPIYLPLFLLAVGFIARNAKISLTGWAIGQAELLGALIVVAYKAFTGRAHPAHSVGADISHVFHFGFLRGGVFWGWPSSHTDHRFRHGRDGVHALAETTVAGSCGNPLRVLYRHGCLHDHPLVLGFRGRRDHRLGHRDRGREKFSGKHSTLNIQRRTSKVRPAKRCER